ncbi:RNA polymerase sigma factor [Actinomadura hibisca]|uniref:RNA polymerase sigma factor n=1 Tax=Actinomadura hibisca TaxID=68565 RepID=UPI000834468D|nr:sigma-70 family RNA polymerase sigma factor [Actinomadura hibisca]
MRAGDAIALTRVYDAYAPFLFDYCHGMLRDRVEAAGALRGCLVTARERVGGLREPERLRGWLYAIARRECLRRRDSPSRHLGQEAAETGDADLTPEQRAHRAEHRTLALTALAALSGRQREAIDLAVRHELTAADLAGVFGTSPSDAEQLLDGAHRDLAAALHAVLVAQAHHDGCASAAALSAGPWPLSPQEAGALTRHVSGCPTCGAQQVPDLPVDRLLAVLPVAAVPADLKLEVLDAATNPERGEARRAVAEAAGPFGADGWPLPYRAQPERHAPSGSRRRGLPAALGAGAVVIALVAGVIAILPSGPPETPSAAPGPAAASETMEDLPPEPEKESPSASPSAKPSRTPSARPTTERPTPTPSASPSRTPSARPTRTPSRPAPSATPSRPRPPQPGGLSVTGCRMDRDRSCTITITAVGGPVDWRVTGTSGSLAAGGAGHLAAGQSAQVAVERTNRMCWGSRSGSVSFAPGGYAAVSYC